VSIAKEQRISEFDEFFQREKNNSVSVMVNIRNPIRFPVMPFFLLKNESILSSEFIVNRKKNWLRKLCLKIGYLASIFEQLDRCLFNRVEFSFSDHKVVVPIDAYHNYRTLNRNIINFRNGNEPELACLLDLLVPDDGVFVDIGCNWGYFSFYLLTRASFRGQVFSFEPEPDSFAELSTLKRALGDRAKNLKTFQVACGDRDTNESFFVHSNKQSSSLRLNWEELEPNLFEKRIDVQVRRLDSYGISNLSLLKIDVEGFEHECFRGCVQTVSESRPYIFIESHVGDDIPHDSGLAVLNEIQSLGYQFYLPAWIQDNGTFFVGISATASMSRLSLVPFEPKDRLSFGIGILNVFAVPNELVPVVAKRFSGRG